MKVPTKKQIEAEIKKLRDLAPRIRQVSGFGDSNRAAIEAQIKVLAEDMDEDAIYRLGWPEHTLMAALDAAQWLIGEGSLLSDQWAPLVRK